MLPFGVTIAATVPQGSEIPEGLMNNPVFVVYFRTSIYHCTPCQMVGNVMNNEWIYAKESGRGLILSIVMKSDAFARDNHYSSVGLVPPAAHIRTKRPPNMSQKLRCLKCLAGCDL
jgi:hypothetical protein